MSLTALPNVNDFRSHQVPKMSLPNHQAPPPCRICANHAPAQLSSVNRIPLLLAGKMDILSYMFELPKYAHLNPPVSVMHPRAFPRRNNQVLSSSHESAKKKPLATSWLLCHTFFFCLLSVTCAHLEPTTRHSKGLTSAHYAKGRSISGVS